MSVVMDVRGVTLPRFVSASNNAQPRPITGPNTWHGQTHAGEGDPLDFDLLAEYLLDDGNMDFNGLAFTQEHSGFISPEPNNTLLGDPVADETVQYLRGKIVDNHTPNNNVSGDLAHVQQIITAHAAAAERRILGNRGTSPAQPPLSTSISADQAIDPVTVTMPPPPTSMPFIPSVLRQNPLPTSVIQNSKRPRLDTTRPLQTFTGLNGQMTPQAIPQRGGRQKSQAQIDRRRERNRILARRTRLRKKFFFESLQKDVTDLQQENMVLKEIVRSRINPEVAQKILIDCKANDELPTVVLEQCGGLLNLDRQDFSLIKSIQKSQKCFVITDPSLQDNPIVYASEDFLTLTGYSREDVLGRNCRFLQGTETSPAKIDKMRKAVSAGEDVSVTFVNYCADGTPFWNNLFIAALRDAENNLVNFIGVVVKVAAPDPADPEAGKQLISEVSSEAHDLDVVADNEKKVEAVEGVMAIESDRSTDIASDKN